MSAALILVLALAILALRPIASRVRAIGGDSHDRRL